MYHVTSVCLLISSTSELLQDAAIFTNLITRDPYLRKGQLLTLPQGQYEYLVISFKH